MGGKTGGKDSYPTYPPNMRHLILRFLENEAGASVETSIKANTNETTTSSLYLNMYKRGKKYLISMIFKKEKEKQDGKFKLWHFEFCSLT